VSVFRSVVVVLDQSEKQPFSSLLFLPYPLTSAVSLQPLQLMKVWHQLLLLMTLGISRRPWISRRHRRPGCLRWTNLPTDLAQHRLLIHNNVLLHLPVKCHLLQKIVRKNIQNSTNKKSCSWWFYNNNFMRREREAKGSQLRGSGKPCAGGESAYTLKFGRAEVRNCIRRLCRTVVKVVAMSNNQHDFMGLGENQRIMSHDKTWFYDFEMVPERLGWLAHLHNLHQL